MQLKHLSLTLALLTTGSMVSLPALAQKYEPIQRPGQTTIGLNNGTADFVGGGVLLDGGYNFSFSAADLEGTGTGISLTAYGDSTVNGGGFHTEGGDNASSSLNLYDTSTITFAGGADNLNANDASTANILGRTTTYLDAGGSSTINVFGGTIDNFFSNSGTVNINGGAIGLLVLGGKASINGGAIQTLAVGGGTADVVAGDIGEVNVRGGRANIAGGNIGELDPNNYFASNTDVLDLLGTDLTETLDPALTNPGIDEVYSVTGTLLDGTALNTVYYDYGVNTLEFNGVPAAPVPEASSVVSLGLLLLLGAGGVAVSCRHKATN